MEAPFDRFLLTLMIFIFVAGSCQATGECYNEGPKPNIVFIVVDDLGWNDVGWHNKNLRTPFLDKLAREGIVLNQAYVSQVCSPSRAAFMTGMFPYRIDINGFLPDYPPWGIRPETITLAEHLKGLDYSTHMVGKWHLGYCKKEYTPTYQGFDSFYGFLGGGEDHFTHVHGNGLDFYFDEVPLKILDGNYSTTLFQDRAVEIVNSRDVSKPLFLYLPFQAVHFPMQVPTDLNVTFTTLTEGTNPNLPLMMKAVDNAVGKILKTLEEKDNTRETLVGFTTDNGALIGIGSNLPLRGGKTTLWEGGTRAVAFVNGPMLKKAGYDYNGLFHAVDWLPTLVCAAGKKVTEDIDGINQWPNLREGLMEEEHSREHFFYHLTSERGAARVGKHKLIIGSAGAPQWSGYGPQANGYSFEKGCIRDGEYCCGLYDLIEDPTESHDIISETCTDNNLTSCASETQSIVEEIRTKIEEYITKLGRSLPYIDDAADAGDSHGYIDATLKPEVVEAMREEQANSVGYVNGVWDGYIFRPGFC